MEILPPKLLSITVLLTKYTIFYWKKNIYKNNLNKYISHGILISLKYLNDILIPGEFYL